MENLLQKWTKFPCYTFSEYKAFFLSDIKIKLVFDFPAKYLVIHPKKGNITLMNTRPYCGKLNTQLKRYFEWSD